jgi:hypothetical protein
MNIKHVWTVLCRESLINQEDNILSLFGVIEEVTVTMPPINNVPTPPPDKINLPINYEIVNLWSREEDDEEEKATLEIAQLNPKGEELNKITQELVFPANVKRLRSRTKVSGLTIQGRGNYSFRVRIKEKGDKSFKTVSEVPLEVKINQQPQNLQA